MTAKDGAEVKKADEEEAAYLYFFFSKCAPCRRKEAARDNAVRDDGGGISMVHRCGLRPADGESEPNYWLGYSSGPRTDQQSSDQWRQNAVSLVCTVGFSLNRDSVMVLKIQYVKI